MANFFASSLAAGGGSGTELSPFTYAEIIAYINASFSAGDIAWIKADGVYNVAEHTISKVASIAAPCQMVGYTATIGDGGQATIKRSGGSAVLSTHNSASNWIYKNLIFDGNSAGTYNVVGNTSSRYIGCTFQKAGTTGVNVGNYINCVFQNNALYGNNSAYLLNCLIVNNGSYGVIGSLAVINCCIAGNGSYGIRVNSVTMIINSVINNNASGGISYTVASASVHNCIISNHPTGQGIEYSSVGECFAYNCDFYNNTSDTNVAGNLINKQTINPNFNNPATYDFRRTDNALDGLGYSTVGQLSFDYDMHIGLAPNALSLYTAPTFSGITALATAAEGALQASWSAGTNVIEYVIFIKASTSTGLFDAANEVFRSPSTSTSRKIKHLADGNLLDYSTTYYVGVRAIGYGTTETNTASLSAIPSDNVNASISAMQSDITGIQDDVTDIISTLDIIKGLSQENYRIISPTYDTSGRLLTATIKIYPSKSDCNADTNEISEYAIIATYDAGGQMLAYKVTKE